MPEPRKEFIEKAREWFKWRVAEVHNDIGGVIGYRLDWSPEIEADLAAALQAVADQERERCISEVERFTAALHEQQGPLDIFDKRIYIRDMEKALRILIAAIRSQSTGASDG